MRKLLIILFLCYTSSLLAQNTITIKGTIKDKATAEGLIGTVIKVKNSNIGTISDSDGAYTLSNVPSDGTLLISFIGYEALEIDVKGRTLIDILMTEKSDQLNEIVVIGYGVAKRSDLTSSISSIKGDVIKSNIGGNAMVSMQGRVAGVQITGGGSPGSTPRVIIRGVTTANGSDPLYVVDGTPMGNNINFLNQDDIENIEVLKDASASAIYGTRGSNGVVLVTTKRGKIGKTQMQYTSSVGFQSISKPKLAKASEYEKVFKTRYSNDGGTSPAWVGKENIMDSQGTDWWDATIVDQALIQSHNFSFQGGNEKMIYSTSIGYFRQESQYKVGYWDKLTARINTEYTFNKYIKSGIDIAPRIETWTNTPSQMNNILSMDPTTPIYKPQEEWTMNPYSNYARSNNNQAHNPVAIISREKDHTNGYGAMITPFVAIEPIKGLIIRSQLGSDLSFVMSSSFRPDYFIHTLEQQEKNKASRNTDFKVDWSWINTANYLTTINKKHSINATLGYTMERAAIYKLSGAKQSIPKNLDELQFIDAGTELPEAGGSDAFNSLLSYLGRAMYNYDSRYYLTATYRIDGSSMFPSGNKYATFPSISGAWRISGEKFMQNQHLVENLKLRLGWGRVGNQAIQPGQFLSLISSGTDYVFGQTPDRNVGSYISLVGNNSLKWETVEDYNLGIDLTALSGRLNLTADVFSRKSHDMLMEKTNLLVSGYPMSQAKMWSNIGSMKATGWELSANWNSKINDFSYQVGVNLSSIKNTAEKFTNDNPIITQSFFNDYIINNEVGGEISRFYGYIADGIFQNQTEINSHTNDNGDLVQPFAKPGDIRFKDLNNDGKLDEKDKHYIGNAFPDLMIGFNININYKNFDFISNFYGTIGNDIYNSASAGFLSGQNGQNVYEGVYKQSWHGEGTSNFYPRLSEADANLNYRRVSSFLVEDGSYLRCKLLQVGYTIPQRIVSGLNLRLSASAQNLFTITKYKGMDPERAAGGKVLESGVDQLGYPNPRTFLFGINLNF